MRRFVTFALFISASVARAAFPYALPWTADRSALILKPSVAQEIQIEAQLVGVLATADRAYASEVLKLGKNEEHKPESELSKLFQAEEEKYAAVGQSVWKQLTTPQKERIEQIRLQVAEHAALAEPDIQKYLGLSSEQKKAIADAALEQTKTRTDLLQKRKDGTLKASEVMQGLKDARAKLGEARWKAITPAQREKLKMLLGKPHQFPAD